MEKTVEAKNPTAPMQTIVSVADPAKAITTSDKTHSTPLTLK